ncbi:MAG: hypothetical protein ACHQET_13690 [Chitinophagales bacterium]
METLKEKIFAISNSIRYVAMYADGQLISSERPGIENTSSSESDKYEELIVNPTLLKLVTQRGNIDCGGADWVIIRYGSFFEFVMPMKNGHISVGLELDADLMKIIEAIKALAIKHGLAISS